MKRFGQSWSMDVVLAVVVFGFIAVTFTSFALIDRPEIGSLEQESQRVSNELTKPFGTCEAVLQEGVVNDRAAACLFNENYETVRRAFRSAENFCMYLEDADGRIIPVRVNETSVKSSFGSSDITVGGAPCGQ